MIKRKPLHGTNLEVSCLGLGTVKFGRNEQVKYPQAFDLPDDSTVLGLLDLAQEEGINLLDTAPAYGSSETRLGGLLNAGHGQHRDSWVIVSKAGEEFVDGASKFDFSAEAITESVERSLTRLQTDRIDAVLLHSNGNDLDILDHSGSPEALFRLQEQGKVLSVGISTKTVAGGQRAIELGMNCVMITYNPWHTEEQPVLDSAQQNGACSVFIKKGFGSGWFGQNGELSSSETETRPSDPVAESLGFIFAHPAATAVITGTLNPAHLSENAAKIRAVFS